tara:strand:- start:535 stop:1191 length:657 start_codon:yes stop_codon:yes gene_type:complete
MQVEISIPSSLKEVKLKDYQDYLTIEEPTEDDMLKCILNIDQKKLGSIKAKDIDYLTSHISKLFKEEQQLIPTFKMYGVEYGFIPNLDEITYGENKDITSYISDWKTMHKAMAVLYRPIKQKQNSKYLIDDYEGSHKYSEVMQDAPLNVVMGAMVFFYNLTNVLLKSMPSYLEEQTMKEQMQGVISPENGIAIQKYIVLVKETLQDFKQLQSFPFINA